MVFKIIDVLLFIQKSSTDRDVVLYELDISVAESFITFLFSVMPLLEKVLRNVLHNTPQMRTRASI